MAEDNWSQDLTPEPARPPPPQTTIDDEVSAIWDDQSSLPSLHSSNYTFSNETWARVHSTLQRPVPNSISHWQRTPAAAAHSLEDRVASPRRNSSTFKENNGQTAKRDRGDVIPDEVTKPTTIPRDIKLERHLQQVQNDLDKANKKIEDLMRQGEDDGRLFKTIEVLSANNTRLSKEKAALEADLTEEMTKTCLIETELKLAKEEDAVTKEELNSCRSELLEQRRRLAEKERQLKESTSKLAKEDIAVTKEELNSCRSELLELRRRLVEKDTQLKESTIKFQELESQAAQHSVQETRALNDLQQSNDEHLRKIQALAEENAKIRQHAEETMGALDSKCKECLSLQEEGNVLRRRLVRAPSQDASVQTNEIQTKCIEIQTDPTRDFERASLVSERLIRVREESELTGARRQHHDELSRLTEEHDNAMRELENDHMKRLREVEEQAVEEQNERIQQARRSFKTENQKRFDELEKRHRKELAKMRNDYNRKMGKTSESLESALAEVTAVTEQLVEETQMRATLESTLEKLQQEYKDKMSALLERCESELETMRTNWEVERTGMLDEIQQGCNQVIHSRRVATPASAAPKVRFDFNLEESNKYMPQLEKLSPHSQTSSGSTVSQSLAETEAFVLKVLGTNRL